MDHERRSVIGIDIGGANLKYAGTKQPTGSSSVEGGDAIAKSRCFAMWRHHESLADEIASDLESWAIEQPIAALTITMTGELADCFADRAEGVRHIVSHACEAAARLKIEEVVFYGVDGNFHSSHDACRDADRIAAGNWHALANFVGKSFCSDGLLIDIGSTTTDIIPILQGAVATTARTDFERLAEGSLVYIGGRRTPVSSLVDELHHQGQHVSIMNECFATMDDVRLVMGLVAEDSRDFDTADGKPRTCEMSVNRLAKMIGLDWRSFSKQDGVSLASQIHRSACQRIRKAFERVRHDGGDPDCVVISGHASDLIELPQSISVVQLGDHLGQEVSRCAPAYAVASLYCSQLRGQGLRCAE